MDDDELDVSDELDALDELDVSEELLSDDVLAEALPSPLLEPFEEL